MLLVDLRMDAIFVKENMNIKWTAETGIVENMNSIVKEFKETRGLLVAIVIYLAQWGLIFHVCVRHPNFISHL
jgi:hypothetical protein